MADIKTYTDVIKSAPLGETVRDAFCEIIKLLNTVGGDVGSLGGHDPSYYATAMDFAEVTTKISRVVGVGMDDEKPQKESKLYLTSGTIYEAVYAVNDILEDINNMEAPIEDFVKNIKMVEKTKKALRDAIYTQSGGSMGKKSDLDFTKYADYIRHLPVASNVNTLSRSINERDNGKTIYANEEAKGAEGEIYAFNEITSVKVKFKTAQLTPPANKTYEAEEGTIGYNKVTVRVNSRVGGGRSNGSGGTVDENGIANSVTIEENGPFDADGSSVRGWRTVIVDVKDPDIDYNATYTVTFYDTDGTTVIGDPVSGVPYNGSAIPPEPPEKTGLYFKGWDPPPYKIRRDTDCVAQYTDVAPSVEEIPDSWDTIVANRGMNYAVGSYKTLVLNNNSGSIRMQKVAVGEDISTSTWLAMDALPSTKWFDNKQISGWSRCWLRSWLNGEFYTDIMPEIVRDEIIDVSKVTYEFVPDYYSNKFQTQVRDKIWIPSLTEILGDIGSASWESACEDIYVKMQSDDYFFAYADSVISELKGVHYNQVYPDSTVNRYDSGMGNRYDMYRIPSDTTNLVKKLGVSGGATTWMTRTVTYGNSGHNQNSWFPYLAGFGSGGGYTSGLSSFHSTPYPAMYGVVIGFCL